MDAALSGDPDELSVHLSLVQRDVEIEGALVRVHCHCLAVDGNGKVQPTRLAEFMRAALVDYAVPKSKLEQARARDIKYKSGAAMSQLHCNARNTFTDLDNSGEGGELLLYLLAERFLGFPQVLCKMDLKTSAQVHFHGADGVYATVDNNGVLNLFWGESKLYDEPIKAIRACLASLAPFLTEVEAEGSKRERDMMLLSDKADLGDEKLTTSLRKYFDRTSQISNRVKYGGIALVGFDSDVYPKENAAIVESTIVAACKAAISAWCKQIGNRIEKENLNPFEIHFFCLPLPSAENLRAEFKKALGLA